MAKYKNGKCKKLIVAGCMANRYYNELKSDLTEADIIIRTSEYNDLPLLLELEKNGFHCVCTNEGSEYNRFEILRNTKA